MHLGSAMRAARRLLLVVVGVLAAGCGDDPAGPGNGGNGGGIEPPPPFDLFEIGLRPLAIERPAAGAPTPTPLVSAYNLTAFPVGGTQTGVFDWTVPAAVGAVVPKTDQLTTRAATVLLRIRDDGQLPLGFFDIAVHGTNGTEMDDFSARFAVVQNTWMKHRRLVPAMFTEDLERSPTVLPGATLDQDEIYYVEGPSVTTTSVRRIRARAALDAAEQSPRDVFRVQTDLHNFAIAPKVEPDVAPAGVARSEMLLSSRMDLRFEDRCPSNMCRGPVPFNLWVVRRPEGLSTYQPRPLTFDSTFTFLGQENFYHFNFTRPRWDPSATAGSVARIAFLSDLSGMRELWLADLVDRDMDNASDTLVNYRQLSQGGVGSYDWHPDGTRLVVTAGGGLAWIDATSGVMTPIELSLDLERFEGVSVFARSGEHTLVAFQAAAENLSNLFVYDEVDRTVTRVLPYPFGLARPLDPRWHPRRKEIFYSSDYTVGAWANSSGGMNSPPDQLNPNTPELLGQRRTRFPSVWSVLLEP